MDPLFDDDPALYDIQTSAAGPVGSLPLTEDMLREAPSGDIFGLSMDRWAWAGKPTELGRREEFLILSTSRVESALPTAVRSRWATTPATGKSACS